MAATVICTGDDCSGFHSASMTVERRSGQDLGTDSLWDRGDRDDERSSKPIG